MIQQGKIQVVFTDASSLHGWSFTLCATNEVVNGVWDASIASKDINWKELWVTLETLRIRPESLRGWRVLFRCDNVAAVHYVNVRYGNIPQLESLSEQLDVLERSAGCTCLAEHVAGKHNVIADEGSRSSSFSDRWNTDSLMHATLREDLFKSLERDFGRFDMDLFSDREGLLSLAERWRYPELSAFETDLSLGRFWAHPPKAIVGRFLDHVVSEASRIGTTLHVAVLVPCDSGAPWFRAAEVKRWRRRQYWPVGSDLFRFLEKDGSRIVKRKCPRTTLPYAVLTSW